jgi:hypothetical protein
VAVGLVVGALVFVGRRVAVGEYWNGTHRVAPA